jgi:YegS/Rv2252/BmrU family lipid kinase
MAEPIPIIVNGAAGRGCTKEDIEAIERAFAEAGSGGKVWLARTPDEITSLAQRALREGHAKIVAAGGDGTLNSVAAVLVDSPATFGVLPFGTLNHFARDLGIPLTLPEAARVVASGREAAVDVGEVNGRIFLNNSSIGLYPRFVLQRRRLTPGRQHWRWTSFFWALLTVLSRHPMLEVTLTLDGRTQVRRTPVVFIGNNEYRVEGFQVGTRERLDSGKLCIVMVERQGRGPLLGIIARSLFGRLRDHPDFEALTAQSVVVAPRHQRLPVAADGEVFSMDMPLRYRVRPGALRVMLPLPKAD